MDVTLERRAARAFLAEYERTVIVEQIGGEAVHHDLSLDPDGATRVTICQSEEGWLIVHDGFGTIEIKPEQAKRPAVYLASLINSCPQRLGAFDVENRTLRYKPE